MHLSSNSLGSAQGTRKELERAEVGVRRTHSPLWGSTHPLDPQEPLATGVGSAALDCLGRNFVLKQRRQAPGTS